MLTSLEACLWDSSAACSSCGTATRFSGSSTVFLFVEFSGPKAAFFCCATACSDNWVGTKVDVKVDVTFNSLLLSENLWVGNNPSSSV